MRNVHLIVMVLLGVLLTVPVRPAGAEEPAAKAEAVAVSQDKLPWWPTDAQPAPVKDEAKGGYWWWPTTPGVNKELWGNRGYAYVNKIIYNWRKNVTKSVSVTVNEVAGVRMEMKPSLIVKRTIKNFSVRFKGDQVEIGEDHSAILRKIFASLKQNPTASILISGDDGEDAAAQGLGERRAEVIEKFFLDQGVDPNQVNVLGAGRLGEAGLQPTKIKAPGSVQVIIAEVSEVMIPGPKE